LIDAVSAAEAGAWSSLSGLVGDAVDVVVVGELGSTFAANKRM